MVECDYYIQTQLEIEFNNGLIEHIPIDLSRSFYHYIIDIDKDDFHIRYAQYKQKCLEPETQPIYIFNNSKYKRGVEGKIRTFINKTLFKLQLELYDIKQLVQKEIRYERSKPRNKP